MRGDRTERHRRAGAAAAAEAVGEAAAAEKAAEAKALLRIQPYRVRFNDYVPFASLSARVKRCKLADPADCERACDENGNDCRDVTLTRECEVLCTRDPIVPPSVLGQVGFQTRRPPYGPLGPRQDEGEEAAVEWDLGEDLSVHPPARVSLAIDQIITTFGSGLGVSERRTAEDGAPREELEREYLTLRAAADGYDPPMYHACRVVQPAGELVFLMAELSLYEDPATEDGYPGDVTVVSEVPVIPDGQRREVLRLFEEYAAKADPPPAGETGTEVDEWYEAGEDPENPDLAEAVAALSEGREAQQRRERRLARLAISGGALAALAISVGVGIWLRRRRGRGGAGRRP